MRAFYIYFLSAVILILASPATAQSFEFHTDAIFMSGQPGDFMQFPGTVSNTGPDSLHLLMQRTLNNIPGDWSTSLCLGIECYDAYTDVVEFALAAGETRSFALYVNSGFTAPGVAEVKVKIFNVSDPAQFREKRFTASTDPNAVTDPVAVTDGFTLHKAYPNPFNPQTTVSYTLTRRSRVKLEIFSVNGRAITTLFSGEADRGTHSYTWAGRDAKNRIVASGLYLIVMSANGHRAHQKILLIK